MNRAPHPLPGRPAGPSFADRARRLAVPAGAAAWLAAAAISLRWLDGGSATPGPPGRPPAVWPYGTRLALAADRPTLVIFVHPRCPCSRASLAELATILAPRHGRARAVAVFYSPAGAPDDWPRTDRWLQASAIPGVEVVADLGESERRRFAALTSGQVVVYTPAGRLAYAGGVTPGRGHAGPSAGRAAVEALLDCRPAGRGDAPVFGCPLSLETPSEDR